ncbi:MAG: PCMD domain-containing protein [Alloprevotella sp.]|nr:PCMD domain-containing protein [Alloprevotella sp.]
MNKRNIFLAAAALCVGSASALPLAPEFLESYGIDEKTGDIVEYINYGNFDQWITRNIKESGVIGGKTKTVWAIGPTQTINGAKPFRGTGGTPWATSNVLAQVSGITKTNVSVYRTPRSGHGYCAQLFTHLEEVSVLGVINIKVLAAGSLFLGQMLEPITDTKDPMMKLNYGIPFTKKPKAIMFDYAVKLSGQKNRVKQTGFGSPSTVAGMDMPDCILLLQKRWEDANGNIFAKRVGTMVQRFNKGCGFLSNKKFTINYGDITKQPFYQSYMGLNHVVRYAKNSKGQMKPIKEVGWGSADDEPTHLCLQFDSSHGGAYVGSVGNTLWVDNVRLVY